MVLLFTSIPVKLTVRVEVENESLDESDSWKETTDLTEEQVIDL